MINRSRMTWHKVICVNSGFYFVDRKKNIFLSLNLTNTMIFLIKRLINLEVFNKYKLPGIWRLTPKTRFRYCVTNILFYKNIATQNMAHGIHLVYQIFKPYVFSKLQVDMWRAEGFTDGYMFQVIERKLLIVYQ